MSMIVLVVSLNDDVIMGDKGRTTAFVILNAVPTYEGAFILSNLVERIRAHLNHWLSLFRGPRWHWKQNIVLEVMYILELKVMMWIYIVYPIIYGNICMLFKPQTGTATVRGKRVTASHVVVPRLLRPVTWYHKEHSFKYGDRSKTTKTNQLIFSKALIYSTEVYGNC